MIGASVGGTHGLVIMLVSMTVAFLVILAVRVSNVVVRRVADLSSMGNGRWGSMVSVGLAVLSRLLVGH